MEALLGRCHCGRLEVRFETPSEPATLEPRACQCSFCVRHGARCVSDPAGRITLTAHDGRELVRYRFGLRTADFLLCRMCGVYVAALLSEGPSAWATLNIATLDQRDRFSLPARAVSYDDEDEAGRRERRRTRWTPAVLEVEG